MKTLVRSRNWFGYFLNIDLGVRFFIFLKRDERTPASCLTTWSERLSRRFKELHNFMYKCYY